MLPLTQQVSTLHDLGLSGTVSSSGDYTIRRNKGGMVPAMLTGGEFVVGRESVQKYGPDVMRSINSGHFSGFSHGGQVGGASTTTNDNTKNDISINVNISGGGVVSEDTQANTAAGGVGDPKEFGKRIKAAVLDVIQQEKRTGGMLR